MGNAHRVYWLRFHASWLSANYSPDSLDACAPATKARNAGAALERRSVAQRSVQHRLEMLCAPVVPQLERRGDHQREVQRVHGGVACAQWMKHGPKAIW